MSGNSPQAQAPGFGRGLSSYLYSNFTPMGQYFKAINLDKREVVCPWCLGGVAKLWEWAANPWGAIFTLLLRKSDGSGGGDYYGYRTLTASLGRMTPDGVITADGNNPTTISRTIQSIAAMEGRPVTEEADTIVGRWAGDRVMLIGDYDSSKLWNKAKGFRNISERVVEAWNPWIEIEEMKLKFNPDCSCNEDK